MGIDRLAQPDHRGILEKKDFDFKVNPDLVVPQTEKAKSPSGDVFVLVGNPKEPLSTKIKELQEKCVKDLVKEQGKLLQLIMTGKDDAQSTQQIKGNIKNCHDEYARLGKLQQEKNISRETGLVNHEVIDFSFHTSKVRTSPRQGQCNSSTFQYSYESTRRLSTCPSNQKNRVDERGQERSFSSRVTREEIRFSISSTESNLTTNEQYVENLNFRFSISHEYYEVISKSQEPNIKIKLPDNVVKNYEALQGNAIDRAVTLQERIQQLILQGGDSKTIGRLQEELKTTEKLYATLGEFLGKPNEEMKLPERVVKKYEDLLVKATQRVESLNARIDELGKTKGNDKTIENLKAEVAVTRTLHETISGFRKTK